MLGPKNSVESLRSPVTWGTVEGESLSLHCSTMQHTSIYRRDIKKEWRQRFSRRCSRCVAGFSWRWRLISAADKLPLLITGPFSLWWPSLCCLWQTHHFIVTPAGSQTVGKPSVMKSTNSGPASSKKGKKKLHLDPYAWTYPSPFIHLLSCCSRTAAGTDKQSTLFRFL